MIHIEKTNIYKLTLTEEIMQSLYVFIDMGLSNEHLMERVYDVPDLDENIRDLFNIIETTLECE